MKTDNTPLHARCSAAFAQRPRLSGWLIAALLLALLVWTMAPQQLPVSVYKLSLVTLAGVIGYWLDRSMFPYARPDAFLPEPELVEVDGREVELELDPDPAQLNLAATCMLRRALIVAATMLAMGLGA